MNVFAFDHLADDPLVEGTRSLRDQDRLTTALVVARLAEIDFRQIARREGYRSTTAWCIVELEYSEDEASRRCRAAGFGRQFPVLFEALADGRLHLSAVNMIGPHLTDATVDEWVAMASHKTVAEIRSLIALRRPRPDGPDGIVELPDYVLEQISDRVIPTAPQRCLFQCAGGETLQLMFREALELMSHQNPAGKYEPVLLEALGLLIPALKKQKFAASGVKGSDRYVSSEVKKQVWERDGGACTFVGEHGRHCDSRWQVEFDHVEPVACGGEATVDQMRCLCRPHNQLEAERRFGAGFMEEKRRRAAEGRRAGRIEMRTPIRAGAEMIAGAAAGFRAGAESGPNVVTEFRAGAELTANAPAVFCSGADSPPPRSEEGKRPAAA